MYTFNNSDITTLYIKELLKEFNLPSYDVFKPGDLIYKDCIYIYKNLILKSLVTEVLNDYSAVRDSSKFKILSDSYIFGDYIFDSTKNLKINSLIYDSYTHEYLGNYLRFIRDYKGIDLMSMYNCFSNRTIPEIKINNAIQYKVDDKTVVKAFEKKDDTKVYMVNIQPYKEYTIYIDSNEPVEMVACYYKDSLMDLKFGSTQASTFPYYLTYVKKSNLSFNKPFIYNKLSKESLSASEWDSVKDPLLYNQRDNLKLLIKVSANNNSSIVVLEGNYEKNNEFHFNNNTLELIDEITSVPYNADGTVKKNYNQGIEKNYLSKIGLVNIQSKINHPFSDRLLEYLFELAIVPYDKIDDNISRVQKLLLNGVQTKQGKVSLNSIGIDGIWNNAIRNCNYAIAKNNNIVNSKYDIIGYVDKDIERAIVLEDED